MDIFQDLTAEKSRAASIAKMVADKFFPPEQRARVLEAVGITDSSEEGVNNLKEKPEIDGPPAHFKTDEINIAKVEIKQNGFIAYLNSLHNLGASGSNSLAESQALSPYFSELYSPFPAIEQLTEILTDEVPRIVILTGHAGDGKSTVALDVIKKLRGFLATNPLGQPMNEREDIDTANGPVSIIKDMSELSAERRQQWLHQAFQEPGSWLIISNTGPLLSSLTDYAKERGIDQGVESDILDCLDRPLNCTHLSTNTLDGFGKELVILNLTRWDNLDLVGDILSKLVNHSGWEKCAGCKVEAACPLMLNRKALRDAGSVAGKRVRWIYQRISAYEQRLTLRQIVAHLAIGLTGGMGCESAFQQVRASTAEGSDRGSTGLEQILFSEGFFGYRGGKPWPDAHGLHAIALVRRTTFGAPVGVDFERRLPIEAGIGWAILPSSLDWLGRHWRQKAAESTGVRLRSALRRMAYVFGVVALGKEESAQVFLNAVLQSPSLQQLDSWQTAGRMTLTHVETKRLRTACLRVLLDVYSGFSSGQFQSNHDTLYLTLHRPDLAVVQPTQLVIETLPFRDFDLQFDPIRCLPVLRFNPGQAVLLLTLPLLDYIRRRDAGELGNALSPIHQAQLDWFRAELLRVTAETRQSDDEIALLRAGIDGKVHLHRFLIDCDQGFLEQG